MNLDDFAKSLEETRREMIKTMSESLYGDNALLNSLKPLPPTTLIKRWKNRFSRVKTAWLVLIGKIDPYDY